MTSLFKTLLMFTTLVTVQSTFAKQSISVKPGQICTSKIIERRVADPADVHQVYSGIQDTLITIQDFQLRLKSGDVVVIPTQPTEVDLQDLTGLGRGLNLSTFGVNFPGDASAVEVTGIRVRLVNRANARIISADNSSCALEAQSFLNLYTASPISVFRDQNYLVKVGFNVLDDIGINVVTSDIKTTCCTKRGCTSTTTATSETRCSLANRRQPILTIIRPSDEF